MSARAAWLLVLVIALYTGFGHLRPVVDPDTPWHLQQAETGLRLGTWTYPDETSFTVAGRPYVNHPWLGELALLGAYRLGGWSGLSWLCVFGGLLAVLAVGWAAWVHSQGQPELTVLTTALVAPVLSWRVEARPLLFFLTLLPVSLVLVHRYARARGRAVLGYGAALLAAQAVWIPIHGSYVLLPPVVGLGLLATARAFGLGEALRRGALLLLLLGLILLQADLHSHTRLIEDVALGDATKHIAEMKPLTVAHLIPSHLNSILFLDLLLGAVVLRSLRRRPRLEDLGLVVLGLLLAFTASRFRTAWGILCLPLVARAEGPAAPVSPWLRRAALVLALCSVPVVILNDIERDPTRGFGAGLSRDAFPQDSAAFLDAVRAQGNLLNAYDDGGYLAHRVGPRVKIAIDGRTPTLFDDELYFQLREAVRSPHALARFEQTYHPDMALPLRAYPQCRALAASGRWRAVYVDAERTLFFRREFMPEVPGLAALEPCAPEAAVAQRCAPGQAEVLSRELERLLGATPDAPFLLTLASQFTGGCLGQPQRAAALAGAALATGTRRPEPWLAYARAQAAAGAHADAQDAAEQAAALGAEVPARLLVAQVQRAAGQDAAALATLEGLSQALGDQLPLDARLSYAELLAEAGRWPEARLHAQRAQWVGTSTRARVVLERAVGRGPMSE